MLQLSVRHMLKSKDRSERIGKIMVQIKTDEMNKEDVQQWDGVYLHCGSKNWTPVSFSITPTTLGQYPYFIAHRRVI